MFFNFWAYILLTGINLFIFWISFLRDFNASVIQKEKGAKIT